jgi:hypothetical protein
MDTILSDSAFTNLIDNSLSGFVYDLALVVHRLYKSRFVCSRIRNRQWFVFDGLRWTLTEVGPYHVVSSDMVKLYQKIYDEEATTLATLRDVAADDRELQRKLDLSQKRLGRVESIIGKLKNVNFKESLCKECVYLFYDPEFLMKLDQNRQLICFKNGVLDLQTHMFRDGVPDDFISLMVSDTYLQVGEAFQQKIQKFIAYRESILAKRKAGYNIAFQFEDA